tara:strand:- start:724 stop:1029 length:306 start_codon:yes stop_codon:yes gene_type:complete
MTTHLFMGMAGALPITITGTGIGDGIIGDTLTTHSEIITDSNTSLGETTTGIMAFLIMDIMDTITIMDTIVTMGKTDLTLTEGEQYHILMALEVQDTKTLH